eukprot:scaffold17817_cov33-Tisochrysis_lutea.AAC.4
MRCARSRPKCNARKANDGEMVMVSAARASTDRASQIWKLNEAAMASGGSEQAPRPLARSVCNPVALRERIDAR